MLIKLTEFDGDSLVINSASIAFIRPCKTKNVKEEALSSSCRTAKNTTTTFM